MSKQAYATRSPTLTKLSTPFTKRWPELFDFVSTLSVSHRKLLITLCRSGVFPDYATTLHTKMLPLLNHMDFIDESYKRIQNRPIVRESLVEVLFYRSFTAFLLCFTLSLTWTFEEAIEMKQEMVFKELSTMEKTPTGRKIEWYRLGEYFTDDTRLNSECREMPYVHRRTFKLFESFGLECQDRMLYPHSGTKAISKQARARLEDYMDTKFHPDEIISSTNLEQFYATTGVEFESPCSMCQRWYPTNYAPRTYYQMGSSAYFASRYLRDWINSLADKFDNCNRYRRVQPSLIPVSRRDDAEVFIYDLTSFSSNMEEQKFFLEFLASFYQGLEVEIFDTFHGPKTVFLSDLLTRYNKTCNISPKYCIDKLWLEDVYVDLELTHSIAGFLGVYANIMSCTLPHAIILASLSDSLRKSWCAGDDAGHSGIENDERDLNSTLAQIGIFAQDKVYKITETGAQALKRPIRLCDWKIEMDDSIVFPVLSCISDYYDGRFEEFQYDAAEVRSRVASTLFASFNSIRIADLWDIEKEALQEFFTLVYKHFGLPFEGYLPQLGVNHKTGDDGKALHVAVPIWDSLSLKRDPMQYLCESYYTGTASLPLKEYKPVNEDELRFSGEAYGNMTKKLGLMKKLGYIEVEEVEEVYTDTIGYENLLDWLTHRSKACPSVYRITVIDSIPEFYWNDPFDQYEVFAFTQETTVDTRLASILYDANELDY